MPVRSTILSLAWLSSLALAPLPARAQNPPDPGIIDRCSNATISPGGFDLCHDVAAAAQVIQTEAGLALVGGNPVLGTASPLGPRFRAFPRTNLGGRLNFSFVSIPEIIDYPFTSGEPTGTRSFVIPAAQAEAAIGLFKGFALNTTLGGFGAIDLLGSLSAVMYPGGEGFQGNATGLGLGARVGVVRESFSAPGISGSIYRKWHGRVVYGSLATGDDAELGLDLSAWSFRAGISKSLVAFSFAGTIGWDSYQSDVDITIRDTTGTTVTVASEADPVSLSSGRWSAFLDVAYVVLFMNIVAEFGWQESARTRLSNGGEIESGKFFGSFGMRISL